MTLRALPLALCLSLACTASSDDDGGGDDQAATTLDDAAASDGGVELSGYGPCDGEPNAPCGEGEACLSGGAGEYCAAECAAGCGEFPGAACVAQTAPGAPTHCGIECTSDADCPSSMACVELDAAESHAAALCMWS
jgi:hypothetical protein